MFEKMIEKILLRFEEIEEIISGDLLMMMLMDGSAIFNGVVIDG